MYIYVCSPYGGKQENYEAALGFGKYVVQSGHIPIIPHTMYHGILDDRYPDDRTKGLRAGLALLGMCDEVWVFGEIITDGMMGEINEANRLGIRTLEIKGQAFYSEETQKLSQLLKKFELNFGYVNTVILCDIKTYLGKGATIELINTCIDMAARKNAPWKYAAAIIERSIATGVFTAADLIAKNKKPQSKKGDYSAYDRDLINKILEGEG